MAHDSTEVARSFFRLLEKLGTVWDDIDPDFEIHDHDIPDAEVFRGRAGLLGWVALWGEAWDSTRLEVEDVIDAGDNVVVLVRMYARGKGSGVEVRRREGAVCALRDGKLVRLDYYGSAEQALAAAGVEQPAG